MNKVLHVLVYVFLILAAAGLYFELQLDAKRSELTDRNRMQEDYIVKIAKTIEKAGPDAGQAFEIKKDVSPVEARLVDAPDQENVLDEYQAPLEQANLETFSWDDMADRDQLRKVYVTDGDGKPVMDGNEPLKRGKGTEDEMLGKLFDAAKAQQSRLNSTRAALTELRGKLDESVSEINKLKPEARQDKVTIEELNGKLTAAEEEKASLEAQVTKKNAEISKRDAEITSLNDEVSSARDEVAAKDEELSKAKTLIDSLKKRIQESVTVTATPGNGAATAGAAAIALPAGDKGTVVVADNANMFAIVKFPAEVLSQLKGGDASRPLPAMEFGVRREGFKGPAGEFVGRVRIRQEVKGKDYVICDIMGNWEQAKMAAGDVLFAD